MPVEKHRLIGGKATAQLLGGSSNPGRISHRFHNPPVEGAYFTCARMDFDEGRNPVARALPSLIVLSLRKVPGLHAVLELLFAEADHVRCGHRLLADRLFEVALIQLLRWLLDHPEDSGVRPGLITGLSDPRLGQVLVRMHERPGMAWTLEQMAECAAMSPTSFATTFKAVVGADAVGLSDRLANCPGPRSVT